MNTPPTESVKIQKPPRGIAISGLIFSAFYVCSLVLLRRAVPADSTEIVAMLFTAAAVSRGLLALSVLARAQLFLEKVRPIELVE